MAGPELTIPIGVNLDKFRRGMAEAGEQTERTASGIEGVFKNLNPDVSGVFDKLKSGAEGGAREAGNSLGLIIGTGISLALTGAIAGTLALVGNLAKLGDKAEDMRLPVNLLQALSVAAETARVPTENVTKALEKFTAVSKLGGADAEKFEKALSNVGDSFLQAFKDAPSQEARLRIISNALKSTTDEVKRAQLALQAFGTDNERTINLLGSGAKSLDDYAENAKRLGLAIDVNLVKHAQEARSQLSLLSRVLTDQFTGALGDLIPVLVKIMPYLQAIALAGQAVGAIFRDDATASSRALKDELDGLITRWVSLKEKIDAINKGETSDSEEAAKRIRKFFGFGEDPKADGDALIKELEQLEKRTNTLRKQIASNDAAPAPDRPGFKPRVPLDTGSSSRDRFDAAADSIEKRTEALIAETGAIDLGTEARTRARIAAELETIAKQLNKEAGLGANVVTAEQTKRINEVAAAWGKASVAMEQANSPLNRLAREGANVNKALNQFAADSLNGLTNELAAVVTGATSAQDAFKRLADAIIQDLARIAIRMSITGPLAKMLGGVLPGGGGLWGEPGGPIGHPTGSNAAGTNDWRGGPTWVGEQGPEILNLPKGSQIIPNNIASKMGSSGGVIVNNYGSNEVKVSERPSAGGFSMDRVVDIIDVSLADRQMRGRGAMTKVNKTALRG